MKLPTHLSLQALLLFLLGVLVKYGDQLSGIIPTKYQPFLQLAIGLSMSGLAWYNHYFNTDGTPQTAAFLPKKS